MHKWKHKFTPGSTGVGVGGTLKNGHLNQQPVVAGLLVVK